MIPIPTENDGEICGICRSWLPEYPDYQYYGDNADLETPGCCPWLPCCAQNVHGACLVKELVRQCPDYVFDRSQNHG